MAGSPCSLPPKEANHESRQPLAGLPFLFKNTPYTLHFLANALGFMLFLRRFAMVLGVVVAVAGVILGVVGVIGNFN